MSLLALLLLLSVGPPQDYQIQALTPQQRTAGLIAFQAQRAAQLDRNQIQKLESSDNTCFAIRSYIFRREDGNAPELAGTTTCTPANALHQRQVRRHPAQLVPLDLAPGN